MTNGSLVLFTFEEGDILVLTFHNHTTLNAPVSGNEEGRTEMFYLTTHSTHFIYGYMASDKWLRTILIAREETRCRHIGYSFRLAARVILYAPSHRQDSTYHGLCYTSRGALAKTRNSSMGVHTMKDRSDDPLHHERTLLPRSYISLRGIEMQIMSFLMLKLVALRLV